MDALGLALTTIGTVAGIAGAWFAYVAVRGRVRRAAPAFGQSAAGGPYDVFLSYAAADDDLAERIGRALQSRGLRVFLAKWIGPGLVRHLEKEAALEATRTGILLFSTTAMAQAEIRDDYAAILQRTHEGGRRFIPVLAEPVALPLYARIRQPLDLTDGRDHDANIDALAKAIRHTR